MRPTQGFATPNWWKKPRKRLASNWWLDNFVRSSFWKAARARFMPLVCEQTLPWSLWLSFELEERDRLLLSYSF